MEQIRSFIAIELPEDLKLGLAQLQRTLKANKRPWVKWVHPYGIHLTLKFLGNIEAAKIDDITKAMQAAARGIPPFHLEAKDLGAFPNLRRVQVVWVGISGDLDKLGQFVQRIESNLVPLGFATEGRPFVPHLTLGRVRNEASFEERQELGQLIASAKFEVAYAIEVEAVNLMRSQLSREGAIYSVISSVKLS